MTTKPAAPKMDRKTRQQKVDKTTGALQWQLQVMALDETGGEILTVTLDSEPKINVGESCSCTTWSRSRGRRATGPGWRSAPPGSPPSLPPASTPLRPGGVIMDSTVSVSVQRAAASTGSSCAVGSQRPGRSGFVARPGAARCRLWFYTVADLDALIAARGRGPALARRGPWRRAVSVAARLVADPYLSPPDAGTGGGVMSRSGSR